MLWGTQSILTSSDTEISSFRLRRYACPTTVLPSWLVHYWHLTHPGKSVWFYVCLKSNEYFAESTPCQESRWFIWPCERGEWGHTKPLLKNHHEQSEPWKLPLSLSIPLYWGTHFCHKKKLLLARCFPLSIHLTVVHTFLPKKNTILEGFTPSTIPLTGAHILDKITTTFQV